MKRAFIILAVTLAGIVAASADDGYYIFRNGTDEKDGTGNPLQLLYFKSAGKGIPYVVAIGPDGNAIGGGAGSTSTLTPSGPTTLTVSGTIAAGARTISFVPSSDFSGSINGGSTLTGTSSGSAFKYGPIGEHTLAAINYVITTGTLTKIEIR